MYISEWTALALLPVIVGFAVGMLLGGWMIDQLRRHTKLSAIWVSLTSMTGALAMSVVIFSPHDLTAVLVAEGAWLTQTGTL